MNNTIYETYTQVISKRKAIGDAEDHLLQLKENNTYRNIKHRINEHIKHADKLKTQRGKDRIYNKIAICKQRTKELYNFDYDAHINEISLIEANINILKGELKVLENELNDLRYALYTNNASSKVYEPERLCDKVWNRRSNR